MTILLSLIVILSYLLTSLLLVGRLFYQKSLIVEQKTLSLAISIPAVFIHLWLLSKDLLINQGFNFSFFTIASLVAWLIIVMYLLLSLHQPTENLGIVLLPLAAIAVAMDIAFPHIKPLSLSSWPLQLHILLSFTAYSLLALAAGQAILVAIQEAHLHNHHPGGFIRALPPLQLMETILFQLITLGFLLLSFGLFSGFLFLEDLLAQHVAHKTILSLMAWLIFAVLLLGRWQYGWRGQTATRWTLSGFFVLMIAYFGSKMVLELILQY